MKITVILTPSASLDDVRTLEKQSLESISEMPRFKHSGRNHVVTVIVIGQPLSDTQCNRLLLQRVYTFQRQ